MKTGTISHQMYNCNCMLYSWIHINLNLINSVMLAALTVFCVLLYDVPYFFKLKFMLKYLWE